MSRSAFAQASIHFVLLGDETTASTRVRGLSLITELKERGHLVTQGSLRDTVRAPWILGRTKPPDVLVLQKVFPPTAIVDLLRRRVSVLVLEVDDAVHLGYPGDGPRAASKIGGRVRRAAAVADVLTTPSPILATDLVRGGRSLVFPGPAPRIQPGSSTGGLVWLGSPSTEVNLELLRGCGDLFSNWRGGARAVGGGQLAETVGLTPVTWSPATEKEVLSMSTVGVMPITRSEWNDRKAAYKVLEYLAAGVAPIASSSPSLDALGPLRRFVEIVRDHNDWPEVLRGRESLEPTVDWREVSAALDLISAEHFADAWEESVLA
jgi:hypothetical protein